MESLQHSPHRQCVNSSIQIIIGIPLVMMCGLTLWSQSRFVGFNDSITAATKDSILPTNNNDFHVGKRESLGFFDDIPSRTWDRMKEKVKDMSPNFNPFYLPFREGRSGIPPRIYNRPKKPGNFYQNNYEPDFVCQHERRIGSNNDFSFEEAVLDKIGHHCEIHTFDFGNYLAGANKVGYRLHNGVNKTAVNYHQIGLGSDDPPRFKSLKTVVNELGHNNRTVDIFKIDCEGCEWATAKHWFEADITLRQIQIELHQSKVDDTPRFFDMMYENKYVITHKESNIEFTGPGNVAIEYAFLKLAPEFFAGYVREKGGPEGLKSLHLSN
eukprot:scaffold10804_cov129-Skeletonema_marinoi.AAC.1